MSRGRVRETNYDLVLSDIEKPFSLGKLLLQLKVMGLTEEA